MPAHGEAKVARCAVAELAGEGDQAANDLVPSVVHGNLRQFTVSRKVEGDDVALAGKGEALPHDVEVHLPGVDTATRDHDRPTGVGLGVAVDMHGHLHFCAFVIASYEPTLELCLEAW